MLLHKYDKIFARKATVCLGLVFSEFCVSYDGAIKFFYRNDDLFDDVRDAIIYVLEEFIR